MHRGFLEFYASVSDELLTEVSKIANVEHTRIFLGALAGWCTGSGNGKIVLSVICNLNPIGLEAD